MRAYSIHVRQMVLGAKRGGWSFARCATEFGLSVGTVKAWWSRHRQDNPGDMQPGMQPLSVKGKQGDMQPIVKPDGALFRGVRWSDMPGKTAVDQKTNFWALKQGKYPPRSWKIAGHLEGQGLIDAMAAVCAKFSKKKGVLK